MNPGSKYNQSSFRQKAAESAVRRNFEMYLPNTSYPMFDAYMRSQPCAEARKRNDLSTDGGNLEKYLIRTEKERLRMQQERKKIVIPDPPASIRFLLTLQNESNGRFDDLESVLSCLSLSSKIVRTKVRNIHLYAVSGMFILL